ncbi:N-6 DNA methylase [Actinoalloteichus caeruleus]|uniref:N-6 DNA methylase n=1 Tax=Actinoalloteichus cyanogriseus TaxID=2893586 RepID=UPI00068CB1F3|nr:N-6 DNA methylase [Actinoalloteichus caeruleus]
MSQDATVNAAEIARLVDVGRAAVSNWRRRHEDFPQPIAGTTSSPLFSLREVEDWLRRNGKPYEVSLADRVWQRLRLGDDLSLGDRVAATGRFLLSLTPRAEIDRPELDDPDTARLLIRLAEQRGPAAAFEFVCARYAETHSRRLALTSPDLATLMVTLTDAGRGTVLDPACGLGTLLMTAPSARRLGQDIDPTRASITESRLRLHTVDARIAPADTLLDDHLATELADAVVCDPPFNERSWGHAHLTADPRWQYGIPPRSESELAWVQHCLARLRPAGHAAVLMPPAAAGRRAGRRIRANLLRAGALRAVVTLAAPAVDLWLLRRPHPGDTPPSHLMLMAAEGDDPTDVLTAWRRFDTGRHDDLPPGAAALPVVDLLDETVDVGPTSHRLGRHHQNLGARFHSALDQLRALTLAAPTLTPTPTPDHPPPTPTTLGELARAGLVTIRTAPTRLTTGTGREPVLTATDLAEGGPPSDRAEWQPGCVRVDIGDVVAGLGAVRVVDTPAILAPPLTRYRVDPDQIDPHFLAGVLLAATARHLPGASRVDPRRAQVPRLPIEEQRAYGRVVLRLLQLQDQARQAAELGRTLVRLGVDGLLEGSLRPGEPGEADGAGPPGEGS